MLLEGNGVYAPEQFNFLIKPGVSKFQREINSVEEAAKLLNVIAAKDKRQYFYDCKVVENGKTIGIFDKEQLYFYPLPEKRSLDDEIVISQNMFYGMWHLSGRTGHEKIAERFITILKHPKYKEMRLATNESAIKIRNFLLEVTKSIYLTAATNPKVAATLISSGLIIPQISGQRNDEAYKFLLWDDGFEMLYDCIGLSVLRKNYFFESTEDIFDTKFESAPREKKKKVQEFEQMALDLYPNML